MIDSETFWLEHLQAWVRTGDTQRAYSIENGLDPRAFSRWKNRLQKKGLWSKEKSSSGSPIVTSKGESGGTAQPGSILELLDADVVANELFQEALTHRSVGAKNYERLEFLGDAIVNMVVAEEVFHRSPAANEGDMTRLRAALVKESALAELAVELNVGDLLRLGQSELKSGGARRYSILADVMEALIGAVYVLKGFERAKRFVLSLYGERILHISKMSVTKDPKTRLQEFLQRRGYPLPVYEMLRESGRDHAKTFLVGCRSSALGISATGEGTSRRRAEQAAAQALLSLFEDNGSR